MSIEYSDTFNTLIEEYNYIFSNINFNTDNNSSNNYLKSKKVDFKQFENIPTFNFFNETNLSIDNNMLEIESNLIEIENTTEENLYDEYLNDKDFEEKYGKMVKTCSIFQINCFIKLYNLNENIKNRIKRLRRRIMARKYTKKYRLRYYLS
jgi:hypothetical protein